jgi:hypothetical protein
LGDVIVITFMDANPRFHEERTSPNREAYERAFENYREKAGVVLRLNGFPNPDVAGVSLDSAVLAMETARERYQICRDVLVRDMVSSAGWSERADSLPSQNRIREVAGLLWELEGKPAGSELNDWYRAEDIIRRAAQCPAGR